MTVFVTREVAAKVLEVIDAGLVSGLGVPEPGKMCVEAAVCYALGLPHGDNPETCVCQSLRNIKIRINDWFGWRDNAARASALRRLGLLQLGSTGWPREREFVTRLSVIAIQRWVPKAFRAAATRLPPAQAAILREHADTCERDPSLANARAAKAAAAAAAAAAYAAAYAAASADADAAADAAAYAAADAAADARRESMLASIKDIEDLLIEMQVPGAQWLDLVA